MSYQIYSDATADACPSMLEGLPAAEIIPMEVMVGDQSYTYGPGGDLTVERFYAEQRAGKFATTSQINPLVYRKAFEKALKNGQDVLYLCFSSGLSGTIERARLCMRELAEEYPERKLVCVDSLCASVGEGFLLCEALKKQAEGMGFEEMVAWLEENRLHVCHWFTVDTFDHLRHGGRVSGAVAMLGTALQIKPLLHVDETGHLQVMGKPRGRRKAIETQLSLMRQGWTSERGRMVAVGHGDCPADAEMLKQAILQNFPDADVHIAPIGPIIGAHTGPDMLAVIYWGDNR